MLVGKLAPPSVDRYSVLPPKSSTVLALVGLTATMEAFGVVDVQVVYVVVHV
jgi:hypothetical protein